jgi:integrase
MQDYKIDLDALIANKPTVRGLIAPASEECRQTALEEHSSEPIKSLDDIQMISDYLIENERWRDNMLFIVGINFGLRVSDLRMLRFCDLINDNFTFKDSFPVFEKKTRNTRKQKKNRQITINKAVRDAVILYLKNTPNVSLDNYLFRNLRLKHSNEPLTSTMIHIILKGIKNDLNLNMRVATHTLRKTFCYHQMVMSNNDPRKLMLLSKMLNHSSVRQTLEYIGITEEEIEDAYKKLNLGSKEHNYLVDSTIQETDIVNTNQSDADQSAALLN